MTHDTFERFQGIWLGSIIGRALVNSKNSQSRAEMPIDFSLPNWLMPRKQVAEILLEANGGKGSLDNLAKNIVFPVREQLIDTKNNFTLVTSTVSQQNKLFVCGKNLLLLLPLIMFYGENLGLLKEIIDKYYLKSVDAIEADEIKEDILIWSCLITLLLNNRSEANKINFELMRKKIVSDAKIKNTLSVEKLALAFKAAKEGMSLHQFREKLFTSDNLWQTAISISFYCFVTTPDDFRLSIKRAVNIDPYLASLTAALTGTLSGAYNGITGIPYRWRTTANRNPTYREESQLATELFKAWLGVYSIGDRQELYDRKLCAVATPQIIQPRQALKIISQKELF